MQTITPSQTSHTVSALMPDFIRSALTGEPAPKLTAQQYEELYPFAKAHDLAHFVGIALTPESDCGEKEKAAYIKAKNLALYRFSLLSHEESCIASTLDAAGIPYIFLKASTLRTLYPEAWLRTCSDVDILVPQEQIKDALRALTTTLSYRLIGEGGHDFSLRTPNRVHIELHFCLTERDAKSEKYLTDVFSVASSGEGMQRHLPDDLFYLYLVSHTMKHFTLGGCGIRTIADFYLASEKLGFTPQRFEEILTDCDLYAFAQGIHELAYVWFGSQPHTPLTQQMASFIYEGGMYGTEEQLSIIGQAQAGGKKKYILRRVFLPIRIMREDYPILNRCPILLPFCHIHRWFSLLFNKRRRSNALYRMRQSDADKHTAYRQMLSELGLQKSPSKKK